MFSHKEAIQILKDAGFDAFDISLSEMFSNKESRFNKEDKYEYAQEIRDFADSIGMVCNQAHAPFHSSSGKDWEDKYIFDRIVISMKLASIIGAKTIIIHPKQHLKHAEFAEEQFALNVEFYNSLIPYAKEYGIKIATENMFQWNMSAGHAIDSACSRAREFCRYIDAVNSEWLVGCFDIGHAALMDADLPDFIKRMGKDRLKNLHVHDNNFKADMHTLPFMQKINYAEVTKALGEIDYEGDLTFEADGFYAGKPKELLPASAAYMAAVGRYLIEQIDKARSNEL